MNKVASYLQEHLLGEVLDSADVREYFSTDGSVLSVTPSLVIYPKNTQDIRKVARFTWQLAERGHVLPITARGRGSDQSGAAIGNGAILVFPAHMNRLLELDLKQKLVRVQPGINFRALQQTLETHQMFLPPYPSSIDYCTVGGAIANNSSGEKSVKYGAMRQYVQCLEVVLANGEVIQTGRISKKELEKMKGSTTFEGEVYRQVDGIIQDNLELIKKYAQTPNVSTNSACYALSQVKNKDGSIDLTPLFVGSQGTLGIISEAILYLEPYNPNTTLFKIDVEQISDVNQLLEAILQFNPSALEVVDGNLLNALGQISPNRLKGIIDPPYPALVLLAEFDDKNDKDQLKKAKKLQKILNGAGIKFAATQDYDEQQRLWAIRYSTAAFTAHSDDGKKALPIIEDAIVPRDHFDEYIKQIYELFAKYELDVAIWGHAGEANLHVQPFLDLGKIGDRQKIFKLASEYYDIVLQLGGNPCGERGDGRLRSPITQKVYGPEMYQVLQDIKKAFDPYGTLNPGVKTDAEFKDLVPMLRKEYNMRHLADHLPRS